uniref:Uncharacterized protein n=1 Tax=Denticeps clupeoides TaxID=299321 RepID=A0AAY4A4I7_9TELE
MLPIAERKAGVTTVTVLLWVGHVGVVEKRSKAHLHVSAPMWSLLQSTEWVSAVGRVKV